MHATTEPSRPSAFLLLVAYFVYLCIFCLFGIYGRVLSTEPVHNTGHCMCGGQRMGLQTSSLSAFTWILGIELRCLASYSKHLCPLSHLVGPSSVFSIPSTLIRLRSVECVE